MDAPAPIARLIQELAALDRAYSHGHHGLWSARRRAGLVDEALRELFEAAGAPPRTALAATGGYGRGTLSPGSDVDLLLLHDGTDADAVAALAERMLYPLWDSGLAVGHAVRTPEESIESAAAHLDVLTSMLDGRHVAGDAATSDRVADAVLGWAREHALELAEQLVADAATRHEEHASCAFMLEPELKEGAGGLWDIATLGWIEKVHGRPLEELELVSPRERTALDDAEEFLTRARSTLHLETGKRADTLVLEHQPSIARAMGFEDEPRLLAEDGLMRALFEHGRQVEFLASRILHAGEEPSGVARPVPERPADVLGIAADAIAFGRVVTTAELDAIASLELPDEIDWDDACRQSFLEIIRSPRGWSALDALDRIGALARFLPEWSDVRCRPQRDPYHRYTVDMHLLQTLRHVAEALDADPEDPVEREAIRNLSDREGVLLGALFHDIGKNGERSHVQVGSRVAASAFDRIGVPGEARDLALFMVERHLLLPDTATRRDLTDEDLILDIAATVGTPERLAALYLLAKADAAATGPAASTEWRLTLVRELVAKVQRAFERGEMGEAQAERLTDRIDRVRDLLDGSGDALERFILRMPRSYFLTVPPAGVAAHFGTIAPDLGANEVRTAATSGARAGTYELLVVAADRPGLLSWIAGSLSLAGLSILSAQAFTTDDGAAVDVFEVEGAYEPEVGEDRWREFRNTLRKTIEGRISLENRVAEKRRHYPSPKREIPVTVAVENDVSDFFTVVEVGAADRIGLLYDITRTLSDLDLDVHLAKIATYADRVVDAFYVRDGLSRKITEEDRVDEIRKVVRERLSG